jgi:formate/nitrite transporter FocA (FNT family)
MSRVENNINNIPKIDDVEEELAPVSSYTIKPIKLEDNLMGIFWLGIVIGALFAISCAALINFYVISSIRDILMEWQRLPVGFWCFTLGLSIIVYGYVKLKIS